MNVSRVLNKSMNFNLEIKNYSFKEILKLFEMNDGQDISIEDMKKAKMKVLSMHPDKLKLSKNNKITARIFTYLMNTLSYSYG